MTRETRPLADLRLAQIGNFEPAHSTENELREALEALGVGQHFTLQENEPGDWEQLVMDLPHKAVDLVLWTSTESFAAKVGSYVQLRMLDAARRAGVPVIGYHLDRFIGLAQREETIADRPFFSVDKLYTADGGHQAEWAAHGVNHAWMPPAINEKYCYLAEPDPRYDYDIVFVGGWQNYGHKDWPHRHALVDYVRSEYDEDHFLCLPHRSQPRITGHELNKIYASAKVVLGDSALVPNPDGSLCTRYCSDRIPETLGRGGVLLHPYVRGVSRTLLGDSAFAPFVYPSWTLGDWGDLSNMLEALLGDHQWDTEARQASIDRIKAEHTYTHRMRAVLAEWGWE